MLRLLLALALAVVAAPLLALDVPPHVARITIEDEKFTDIGTGVYVDSNKVLTAAHNLRDHKRTNKLLVDGSPAKVLYVEILYDIALLEVATGKTLIAYPQVGTSYDGTLTAQGYAKGHTYTEVTGTEVKHPDGRRRIISNGNYYYVSGEVTQGMSGGPVLNEQGELVGIISAVNKKEGVSLCVTIESINRAIEQGGGVLNKRFVGRLF